MEVRARVRDDIAKRGEGLGRERDGIDDDARSCEFYGLWRVHFGGLKLEKGGGDDLSFVDGR